jgi:glycosyltransferase involved in cell wall biosynthesis
MKVLMLAPGISPHAQRPLKWLLDSGCDVTFVDGTDPQPDAPGLYRYVNAPVLQGARFFKKLLGERLGILVHTKIATLWLRNLINQIQPDIVHVHWADFRAYSCLKADAKPLIITVWGSDINICFDPNASQNYTKASQWHIKMISDALAGAGLIFVDSIDMVEKCQQLSGCELPIELLPIGIDTTLFNPGYVSEAEKWRQKLSISENTIVLSSVRSWQALYAHHTILEAFYQAKPHFSQEVVLLFKTFELHSFSIGANYKSQLIDRAEELDISDSIRWIDGLECNQLPEIYALSDAIVNYPVMDAFPVTFLEAAACECSVISCRLPSYKDTFAEKCFQLIEPDNIQALADAMVHFVNYVRYSNKSRLIEAREFVINNFSETTTKKNILDKYQSSQRKFRGGIESGSEKVKIQG